MKKLTGLLLTLILIVSAATLVWGQEGEPQFTIKSFARSGILWTSSQKQGQDAVESVSLRSLDDEGQGGQGLFRLELEYFDGNAMGVKTRIQWSEWSGGRQPVWRHAFVYGNFFEDNLTFSVGKLGASPWGAGGPEMWNELEVNDEGGGMRTEWKPSFVPGSLNVGFVLNYFNASRDGGWVYSDGPNAGKAKPITLAEILKETVLGVSYEYPDIGLVRFAFRLDSEYDQARGASGEDGLATGEEELLYRLEEKMLTNIVPTLKIWATGYGKGLGRKDSVFKLDNWLYGEYNPEWFIAQLRVGYEHMHSIQIFHVKPSFYWKFFDNLFNVGAFFWYGQDFGEGRQEGDHAFHFIEVEPRIQFNFLNSYVAFAYTFRQEYWSKSPHPTMEGYTVGPITQIQRMNLRFSLQL